MAEYNAAEPDPFPTDIDFEDKFNTLYVDVPQGHVDGRINSHRVAKIEDLFVYDEGRGRGTYLVQRFAREVAMRGAVQLDAGIISTQAFRNRMRIFGFENMVFTERRLDGSVWVVPLTAEQAEVSLRRAEAKAAEYEARNEDPPKDADFGIHTHVNLTNPDVRRRLGLPPVESEKYRPLPEFLVPQGRAGESTSVGSLHDSMLEYTDMLQSAGIGLLRAVTEVHAAKDGLAVALEGSSRSPLPGVEGLTLAIEHGDAAVAYLQEALEHFANYEEEGLR